MMMVKIQRAQVANSQHFKQALVLPKCITCKKILGGSAKLPAYVSGDEAIAQKIKQKEIAKKCKEEREMKKKERQENQKERDQKVNSADLSDDDDVKCPVCCNNDPFKKWVCCDICDTWYHTGCVGLSADECSQLKDVEWYCAPYTKC